MGGELTEPERKHLHDVCSNPDAYLPKFVREDVLRLLAENERLREALTEAKRYVHGAPAETWSAIDRALADRKESGRG
jgi:hypothetical protein